MRNASVWQRVLGVARTVIEAVVFDEEADPTWATDRLFGRWWVL